MMKKYKKLKIDENNKGITMIALVVTIIVLLLLAGISISMLSGENGILSRAMQAKEATRAGEVQEAVKLAITKNKAEYVGGEKQTKAEVISILQEEGKLKSEEVAELENGDVIEIGGITIDFSALDTGDLSNTLVAMYRNGEGCTVENCTEPTHLHIGDYVNYTNPTSGEWTVPAGELGGEAPQTYLISQNQLNWRVLGIEGTGNSAYIKLIAGSPMKKSNANKSGTDESNPYLYMNGAKSYINAVEQLNKICAICKNDTLATKAESVTLDDIDKLTGVTTDDLKRQYNIDIYLGNNKNYGDEFSFSDQYTPLNWLASTKTTTTVSGNVSGYYYTINQQVSEGVPYVTMSNTRIYNMLFDNLNYSSGKDYWLASVGIFAGPLNAGYGPACVSRENGFVNAGHRGMFYSYNGDENEKTYAVRPVVSLKPGVTNEQCSKTTDKIETTWNYGG